MADRSPTFVTANDLYANVPREGLGAGESHVDGHSRADGGDGPPTRPSAPPDDGRYDLELELTGLLTLQGCDAGAFGAGLRRAGIAEGALADVAVWERDRTYRTVLSAFASVARRSTGDPSRRPVQSADPRQTVLDIARRFDVVGRRDVSGALRRFAPLLDAVYWALDSSANAERDLVQRGSELWEAFVDRALDTAERGVSSSARARIPWSVEVAFDLSRYEFRALAASEPEATLIRSNLLRSALAETEPRFAAHALLAFIAANSVELAEVVAMMDDAARQR